ncbi:MAG: ribonuclease H-like domain-containing protein [Sandaracinaceae bacterium]|nr:ribonuclease H-like domain-containing protein [Sandaracinaceae bacterium]
MDLKRKLSRLASAGPGSRPAAPPPPAATRTDDERRARVERLRGMLGKLIADDRRRMRERAPVVVARAELPGELEETPHGPVHRVSGWLEPAHCHGRVPIAGALSVDPATIAKLALDTELASIDPRRMLFLDTETTGLAGGTGTIPFLIGLAWFEDESLRIEQLVLRAPGEEAPMLRRLAERVEGASCLVSYNGKSYDWPLLRNRFVLNRVPVAAPPAHLDLLHCARRIFKRRLGQVRLVHLEAQVLGMQREHDIDGARSRSASGTSCAPRTGARSRRSSSTTRTIWWRWPPSWPRSRSATRSSRPSTSPPTSSAWRRSRCAPTIASAPCATRRRPRRGEGPPTSRSTRSGSPRSWRGIATTRRRACSCSSARSRRRWTTSGARACTSR